MIKKGIILTALFAIITVFSANAQNYNTGVGLRLGPFYGFTLKHFVKENAALEGILFTRWDGFQITGLYEWHTVAFQEPQLMFFYGFGGHIGFWDNHPRIDDVNDSNIGVDGILGLEYSFREAPISLALDWKPAFNLTGYSGFWGDAGALSIRYTF